MAALKFEITGDNEDLIRKLKEAGEAIRNSGKTAEQTSEKIRNSFESSAQSANMLTSAFLKLGGAAVMAGFIKKLINIRSQFQDTEKSMEVFLGSAEKASEFMQELQKYSYYNMFEFADLTKESAKLLAFGNDVKNVIPIIDRLSNIASGTKQPLGDLIDLFNKAKNIGKIDSIGLQQWAAKGLVITDVLKEMGVEVDRSSIKFEHLEMVLNKVTSEGGMFHGLMAAQMGNLSASTAQVADNFKIMMNEIGENMQGVLKKGIDFTAKLVENYDKVGRAIVSIIATYGAYRAALIVNMALEGQHLAILPKLTNAFKALNSTMLKNPFVLITTIVAGLATALWTLKDRLSAAEKAQADYNKRKQEAAEKEQQHKQKVDELLNSMYDLILADMERLGALSELQKIYPEIFNDLTTETVLLKDILHYKKLINELDAKRKKQKEDDELTDIEKRIEKNTEKYNEYLNKGLYGRWETTQQNFIKRARILKNSIDADTATMNNILKDKGKIFDQQFRLTFSKLDEKTIDKYIEELSKKIEGSNYQDVRLKLPITIEGDLSEEALYETKDIQNLIKALNTAKSVKSNLYSDFIAAKKEWQDAIKEFDKLEKEKLKSGTLFDSADYENAKKRLDEAKKAFEALGGDTSNKTDDSIAIQERVNAELIRLKKENTQALIDLEDDEGKRIREQLELNYKNRIADIKELEQKWREAQKGEITTEQFDEINNAIKYAGDEWIKALSVQTQKEADVINNLIAQYQDYCTQRFELERAFTQDIEKLQKAREKAAAEGDMAQVGQLDIAIKVANQRQSEAISELDKRYVQSLKTIQKLFGDLSKRSIIELKEIRAEVELLFKFLKEGVWDEEKGGLLGITEAEFNALIKSIKEGTLSLEDFAEQVKELDRVINTSETGFKKLGSAFKNLINSVKTNDFKQFKESLSEIDSFSRSLTYGLSETAAAIDAIAKASDNSKLSKTAAIISDVANNISASMSGASAGGELGGQWGAIIGAVIGGVSSLIQIFSRRKQEKKAEAEAEKEREIQRWRAESEINRLIRERYDWTRKIGETSLSYLKRQGKELLWQKSENERYINKTAEKFANKVGWNVDDVLRNWEYWEKKYLSGDLSKEAAAFFEELKKAKEEGEDLTEMMEKWAESMREFYTGTTRESVANGIIEGFKQGKRSAADFADTFEELMQGALAQALRRAGEQDIYDWYEEFAAAAQAGLTEDKIAELREKYNQIIEKLALEADALEKVTGMNIGGDMSQNNLKGAYAKASQESIDLLAGQTGAQRVAIENMLVETRSITSVMDVIRDMQINGWRDVSAIKELTQQVMINTSQLNNITYTMSLTAMSIRDESSDIAASFRDVKNNGIKVKM